MSRDPSAGEPPCIACPSAPHKCTRRPKEKVIKATPDCPPHPVIKDTSTKAPVEFKKGVSLRLKSKMVNEYGVHSSKSMQWHSNPQSHVHGDPTAPYNPIFQIEATLEGNLGISKNGCPFPPRYVLRASFPCLHGFLTIFLSPLEFTHTITHSCALSFAAFHYVSRRKLGKHWRTCTLICLTLLSTPSTVKLFFFLFLSIEILTALYELQNDIGKEENNHSCPKPTNAG
jgi:hypothetical protein